MSNSKQSARLTDSFRNGRLVQGLRVTFATCWAMLGVLYIVKGHPLGWVVAILSLVSAFLLGVSDGSKHKTHPAIAVILTLGVLASLAIIVDVATDLASAR